MLEKTKRILLVDDDADVISIASDVLLLLGHIVVPAHDYYSAVAAFAEQKFDLAIIDYVLEDRTGVELAELLWAENQALPIIIMSGFATELLPIEDQVRNRLLFLNKPFRVDQVREVVKRAL